MWFDPEDDRTARAAWSRLAEPGDEQAWNYVAEFGAGVAPVSYTHLTLPTSDLV